MQLSVNVKECVNMFVKRQNLTQRSGSFTLNRCVTLCQIDGMYSKSELKSTLMLNNPEGKEWDANGGWS